MLKFLSALYCSIIQIRNLLYDLGLFKIYHTAPLVISVGNIEVGGTGKTPFTVTLAKKLKKRGYSVAILTRGYKGRLRGTHLVLPEHLAEDVGDESLLMARTSSIHVVKSPDRVAGARFAHKELGTQIVIMDDGFQHRRIYRDLDIVLVAGNVQTDAPLPMGSLREPVTSLKRANFIIYTKDSPQQSGLRAELVPKGLVDARGNRHDLEIIKGKKVLAVCGLARPKSFFFTLERLGAEVEPLALRDHHQYTDKNIQTIEQIASNKDLIITTQKDMVKLVADSLDKRWLALEVTMQVPQIDTIIKEIETIAENRRIPRQG